ncbi:MAG: desulfoferrodoxin family protein [Lawsonibacter sp.]|nr:desulfoferrodoxin family protein [Lawsonibacter sp.]
MRKHVPVVKNNSNIVAVEIGAVPHAMTEAHYINWVYIQTEKGGQRKAFTPNDKPTVYFALTEDGKVLRAFVYCNLHGLWMKEI